MYKLLKLNQVLTKSKRINQSHLMKSVSPDHNLQDLEQQGPAGESKSYLRVKASSKIGQSWTLVEDKTLYYHPLHCLVVTIAATVGGILGSRANKEDPSNVSSTSNSSAAAVENSNCAAGNTFCTCLSSYAATCASRKCCSGVCAVTTSAGFGAYGLCL